MNSCESPSCAFLIGSRCFADPARPFWIDSSFSMRIKIVGCQSWQRYLDYYERRKRFGKESVGKDTRNEEGRTEGSRTNEVQEVSFPKMDRCGDCERNQRGPPVPVRVLQPGSDCPVDTPDNGPPSRNLGECTVCKKPAVIEDMWQRYCFSCALKLGLVERPRDFGPLQWDIGERK